MASVLHAIDVTLKQQVPGAICESKLSYLSDKSTGLTVTDLVNFADGWEANFLPVINACQSDAVVNFGAFYQARGTTTPTLSRGLAGGGSYATAADLEMPSEFSFWLKFGVDETYESISGDEDLAHPIKRGGMFLCGPTDDYLTSSLFVVPGSQTAAWAALDTRFKTVMSPAGGVVYEPAVLGEEIPANPGTGWRIANINSAQVIRITRLRSRLAI